MTHSQLLLIEMNSPISEIQNIEMRRKQNEGNKGSVVSEHASALTAHLEIHSGKKTYKCNQCDYTTAQLSPASNLRRHMKIHSGEKTYRCNQCDFASVWALALRNHFRTHSGDKSYTCNQCDYAAAHVGNLRAHLKTHLGEKTNATMQLFMHAI